MDYELARQLKLLDKILKSYYKVNPLRDRRER